MDWFQNDEFVKCPSDLTKADACERREVKCPKGHLMRQAKWKTGKPVEGKDGFKISQSAAPCSSDGFENIETTTDSIEHRLVT